MSIVDKVICAITPPQSDAKRTRPTAFLSERYREEYERYERGDARIVREAPQNVARSATSKNGVRRPGVSRPKRPFSKPRNHALNRLAARRQLRSIAGLGGRPISRALAKQREPSRI